LSTLAFDPRQLMSIIMLNENEAIFKKILNYLGSCPDKSNL